MKKIFLWCCLAAGTGAFAQDCDELVANLAKGTLNGLKPGAAMEAVKEKLPCFTGDSEEGGAFNCGGGVFYLNHDFFYYTGNDYIELRSKFKGKVSVQVLGLTKAAAIKKMKVFGRVVRTQKNGNQSFLFFKTSYGCICLTLEDGSVKKLGMYNKPAAKVELCL
jgi:hypothetical protein